MLRNVLDNLKWRKDAKTKDFSGNYFFLQKKQKLNNHFIVANLIWKISLRLIGDFKFNVSFFLSNFEREWRKKTIPFCEKHTILIILINKNFQWKLVLSFLFLKDLSFRFNEFDYASVYQGFLPIFSKKFKNKIIVDVLIIWTCQGSGSLTNLFVVKVKRLKIHRYSLTKPPLFTIVGVLKRNLN